MAIPEKVTLVEVGPRDGFQLEPKIIPTDLKLEMITRLAASGLKYIQVASFVNPRRVPQMADADDLVRRLPQMPSVTFFGLALNAVGVERAWLSGLKCIEVSISASDAHSRRNAGLSYASALREGENMASIAAAAGMTVTASVQCAFGCVFEGEISMSRVLDAARMFTAAGVARLTLADTTGMGTPPAVERMLREFDTANLDLPVGLHLHDTRGLGLVNAAVGLRCGVSFFDTALGGMGGCPFVPGAAGNIATEDTAYLMSAMGVETGVDWKAVASCTRRLSAFLGRDLPGKLYRMA
ncbi:MULTISPECIES: hydroxymethylglutaryl-CoA lyase [Desulfococcus]|uniref:Pyruvate carboxyltransferase n=1 Tax=Desulfococcus multivorans DSM 2059 TaxID=1121405 RepID=S7TP66_DESML|nr:hydroxymethylglutaryl-CoA lyase [Desulfococcus multivorans]AOY57944.1 MvaB: hydroxymehtylglutaryl-CoA lyase [Desulfococcus multivorans]AQV00315.1 hydroxymethylglutaryl-CoA lyase [Desulfococcus multivorans]EPR39027.1 pyruvate carboxyltransferase [Desulfococcus multivorans DSM 2059]SJZ64837.1 hydroxymethylglutaryl-CoA lyase [Desulfococcus multivorans DSM 2059]